MIDRSVTLALMFALVGCSGAGGDPPGRTWTCEAVSPGVCDCFVGDPGSGASTCPSDLRTYHSPPDVFDTDNDVCCFLGGATDDPTTWDVCVCQRYSSIPGLDTCYARPIAYGAEYGYEVDYCPDGPEYHSPW